MDERALWSRIERIFHSALALQGVERANYLQTACEGEEDLRERVESLLAHDDSGASLGALTGHGLGPYEILAPLGAGGMGEVYRARDTRLDRIVAIKILRRHLSSNPQFLERFRREAQVIARLSHPHICTLHDVGRYGDLEYLVMEFLEGETLSSRVLKGSLALDQTLQYGIQIADALDKAHRKGVTHRDLKPGNIMLTKSGAKLLDFGLAKLKKDVAPSGVSPTQLSTAESLTARGTILGTLQYMAPEQLEGRETDSRTDIFALGAVLYEMATGKKAFEGQSQASIIAKILEIDPAPIRSLQPMVPAALDRVVRSCLAKDPENRFQSAQDVKLELEWIRDATLESSPETPSHVPARHRALPWGLFAVTALAFALVAWLGWTSRRNLVPATPVTLQIPLHANPALKLTGALALSPDGRQLAFIAASSDGVPRIWIRALSSLQIGELPGTEPVGTLLFWSPDSRFLAFDSGGKLQKIAVTGGAPETLCTLTKAGIGGSWNKEGVIIFGQYQGPLMRVPAAGGAATPLTVLVPSHGDVAHTEPQFLPDGRHFVYIRDLGSIGAISVGSLDAKPEEQDWRSLGQVSLGVAYSRSSDSDVGQLLFLQGRTLLAQPFDARHLKIIGDPVRVADEPLAQYWDSASFAVSDSGTLAYWAPGNVETQLTWFDAQGKILSRVGQPGPYNGFSLSPDGRQALVSRFKPDLTSALWLLDMSRGTSVRFDLRSPNGSAGLWAPDSHSVVFGSVQLGQVMDLYRKPMSGAADAELLLKSNEFKTPLSWSPDGRFLLYGSFGPETKNDVWVLPLFGDRRPAPLLRTEFDEPDARFSPDGRWVAYVSNESGRYEVYVGQLAAGSVGNGFAHAGGGGLISLDGGLSPRWRQDGRELYYTDLDGKLMSVAVTAGPAFQARVPKFLFQAPPGLTPYEPSPDGKRFLLLDPQIRDPAPITVVLNWQAGLRK